MHFGEVMCPVHLPSVLGNYEHGKIVRYLYQCMDAVSWSNARAHSSAWLRILRAACSALLSAASWARRQFVSISLESLRAVSARLRWGRRSLRHLGRTRHRRRYLHRRARGLGCRAKKKYVSKR